MAEKKEILFELTASSVDIQKELEKVTKQLNAQKQELKDLNKGYNQSIKIVKEYGKSQDILISAQKEISVALDEGSISAAKYQREANKIDNELKQLNSEYNKANKFIQSYDKKQIELKQSISALGKEQRGYLSDLKNVDKLTNAAEGSNDELAASVALLRKEYNKLSKEARENTKEGQRLTKTLAEQQQALIDNNKAVNDNRLNVGNYESAFDGLTGAIGLNVGSLVGPGALVAGVGLAADALIEGGKAVLEIERKFTRLRGEVQSLTGETGPALDDLVVRIESISQVFDQDFNEVLKSANALSKQLGISQQEATDLIEKGFLAGANQSGQFLDILSEYPTQLQAVGLSADESISLITQQVKEGIFTDKGIDTIKEAGLRLRELPQATRDALDGIGLSSKEIEESLKNGEKTIFEVIQMVSKQLNTLPPQSAEVGTAIADIFGGPGEDAGLQYITTLQNARESIDSLIDPSNALTQIQKEQLEVNKRLADAQNELSKVFEGTGGELDKLVAEGKIFLIEVLLEIIKEAKQTINSLQPLFDVLSAIGDAFGFVGEKINDVLEFFGFARQEFDLFGSAAKLLAKAITTPLFGIFRVINNLREKFNSLIDFIFAGIDKIKELSNEFLGTDFETEIDVETAEAERKIKALEEALAIRPEPVEIDLDTQKARAEAAKLGDALTAEEKKAAEKAAKERESIIKKRNAQLRILDKKRIQDEIAGIQLRLTKVREGSLEELELRQKLLDRQLELSLAQGEKSANQELLIKRQTEIKKTELTDTFATERLEIAISLLEAGGKKLKARIDEEISVELAANATIKAEAELTTDALIASQERYTETQKAAARERTKNEEIAQTQTQEFSEKTLREQIKNLQELLTREDLTAQQRLMIEERVQETRLTIASQTFQSLGQLNQVFADIQQAQKQKELDQAQGNAAKEEEIERKFARKEQNTAIRQAIINTALGVTKAFATLPAPFSFIQAAIVGAAGAAQIATISSQSFAEGGFTYEGKKGEIIDSFAKGGAVKKPTLGLIGEEGPEFVAANKTIKNPIFQPAIKAMDTYQTTGAITPFQTGGFTTPLFTDGGQSVQSAGEGMTSNEIGSMVAKAIEGLDISVSVKEIDKVGKRVKVKETQSSI